MSKYSIEIKKSVKKDLRHIPLTERKEIINLIDALSDDPRPLGCKKLKSKEAMYRIRFKTYRVLYEVHDDIGYCNCNQNCTQKKCLSIEVF